MYSPNLVTWRSQYDRMERGYARLKEPYMSSTNFDDDIQHFFQDCWHLKDWIKFDTNVRAASAAIETEVASYKSLRIVADLANGCKHLNRHTHQEGAYVTGGELNIFLGQSKPIEIDYDISLDDGSIISVWTVVNEAFDAWQIVLKKLNLL